MWGQLRTGPGCQAEGSLRWGHRALWGFLTGGMGGVWLSSLDTTGAPGSKFSFGGKQSWRLRFIVAGKENGDTYPSLGKMGHWVSDTEFGQSPSCQVLSVCEPLPDLGCLKPGSESVIGWACMGTSGGSRGLPRQ